MNIMIICNSPDDMAHKLGRVYVKHPPNQNYGLGPVILTTWSAATPFTLFDTESNPNMHLLIVADSLERLWQGARKLLDIVIETSNEDADEWLATLLSGDFPKQAGTHDSSEPSCA